MALSNLDMMNLWAKQLTGYKSQWERLFGFGYAVEAEVRERDEALIRQLVDALEQSQTYVESCANGKRVQGWGEQLDRAQDAINAARSRLEQPSGPAASRGVAFFMVTSAHPSQLHTAVRRLQAEV